MHFSFGPLFHPFSGGSDHTHGCGQTGKNNRKGQDHTASCARQPSYQVCEKIRRIHICRIVTSSLGAQIGKSPVYKEKQQKADDNDPQHHGPIFTLFSITLLLKGGNKNSRTDDPCPYVPSIVSSKKRADKRLSAAFLRPLSNGSQRVKNCQKDHCQQSHKEYGCQIFSNLINHVGFIHCKVVGHSKKHQKEKNPSIHGKGTENPFKSRLISNASASGNGSEDYYQKSQPHIQIVPPAGHMLHHIPDAVSHISHSRHCQHGKQNSGQRQSSNCPKHIFS